MTALNRVVVLALALSAMSAGLAVRAASPSVKLLRVQQEQVEQRRIQQLLKRIGKSAAQFDRSLEPADDRTSLGDPRGLDELRQAVDGFRQAVVRLRDRVRDHCSTAPDVEEVLRGASSINGLAERHQLSAEAKEVWLSLRVDLDRLARAFTIPWNWSIAQAKASSPAALGRDGPPRRPATRR